MDENISAGQNWPTERINCSTCGIVVALCNRCSCRIKNYNCPGCTKVLESSYRTFIQPPMIEYFCTCNLDELNNKTNNENSSTYLGQLVNMFSKCVSFSSFFPIVLMTFKWWITSPVNHNDKITWIIWKCLFQNKTFIPDDFLEVAVEKPNQSPKDSNGTPQKGL